MDLRERVAGSSSTVFVGTVARADDVFLEVETSLGLLRLAITAETRLRRLDSLWTSGTEVPGRKTPPDLRGLGNHRVLGRLNADQSVRVAGRECSTCTELLLDGDPGRDPWFMLPQFWLK